MVVVGGAGGLDQWRRETRETADRYRALRERTEQIRVVDHAAGGAVLVTVDGAGQVADIAVSDKIAGVRTRDLGNVIMASIRRAQRQAAERVVGLAEEIFGADSVAVFALGDRLRARFPEQPREEPPPRWRRPAPRTVTAPRPSRAGASSGSEPAGDEWFDDPRILRGDR